jgi:acyl-CoA dehydrogenase
VTATTADSVVLDGVKTWISNGGIADYYCVFAKTDPSKGTRGITAYRRRRRQCRASMTLQQIHVMAPHPLATLQFHAVPHPGQCAAGQDAMVASSLPCRR